MSTLNIKVSIARRPVSNKPRAIRFVASYADRVTVADAICYAEMGFKQLTAASLTEVVQRFKQEAAARDVNLNIAKDVEKLLMQ